MSQVERGDVRRLVFLVGSFFNLEWRRRIARTPSRRGVRHHRRLARARGARPRPAHRLETKAPAEPLKAIANARGRARIRGVLLNYVPRQRRLGQMGRQRRTRARAVMPARREQRLAALLLVSHGRRQRRRLARRVLQGIARVPIRVVCGVVRRQRLERKCRVMKNALVVVRGPGESVRRSYGRATRRIGGGRQRGLDGTGRVEKGLRGQDSVGVGTCECSAGWRARDCRYGGGGTGTRGRRDGRPGACMPVTRRVGRVTTAGTRYIFKPWRNG